MSALAVYRERDRRLTASGELLSERDLLHEELLLALGRVGNCSSECRTVSYGYPLSDTDSNQVQAD